MASCKRTTQLWQPDKPITGNRFFRRRQTTWAENMTARLGYALACKKAFTLSPPHPDSNLTFQIDHFNASSVAIRLLCRIPINYVLGFSPHITSLSPLSPLSPSSARDTVECSLFSRLPQWCLLPAYLTAYGIFWLTDVVKSIWSQSQVSWVNVLAHRLS